MIATKQLILAKLTQVLESLSITIPVKYTNRSIDVSNIKEFISVYFIYGVDNPVDAMSKLRYSVDTLVIEWVMPLNTGENNTLSKLDSIRLAFDNLLLTDSSTTINFNKSLITSEETTMHYKLKLNLIYSATFYN